MGAEVKDQLTKHMHSLRLQAIQTKACNSILVA